MEDLNLRAVNKGHSGIGGELWRKFPIHWLLSFRSMTLPPWIGRSFLLQSEVGEELHVQAAWDRDRKRRR